MKLAAEYLENQVFEARRPRRDLQPVVTYATAVQAIEQALADAEKYKYLLMRALRHHTDETLVAGPTAQASILPLYPAPQRLAA